MLSWTNGFSQPLSQAQSDTDRLLAQNYRSFNPERSSEDPDLEDDETLEDLMKIEYDKDAWSTSTAIGLSLVPGGGFGLIYVCAGSDSILAIDGRLRLRHCLYGGCVR